MAIKATINIDEDRWAKHPYGVEFDDSDCDSRYGTSGLNHREECYRIIERARKAGFDIDSSIDERLY